MLRAALRALETIRLSLTPRHMGARIGAGLLAALTSFAALVLAIVAAGIALSREFSAEIALLILAGILLAIALVAWAVASSLARRSDAERARARNSLPGAEDEATLTSLARAMTAGFAAGRGAAEATGRRRRRRGRPGSPAE